MKQCNLIFANRGTIDFNSSWSLDFTQRMRPVRSQILVLDV